MKKVGHALEFLFGICWWTWKTIIYLKNCRSGLIKNKFNTTMLHLKKKKSTCRYRFLHAWTKNLDDMVYSSWDIDHDGQKLVILRHFLPFQSPKNPKNQNFEKTGFFVTHLTAWKIKILMKNHMMYGFWDMELNTHNFLSFWTVCCPFTPLKTQKIKILKKWEKPLNILSFYAYVP